MYPKLIGKQEQAKPKSSRWKAIIKSREEISEMRTKKIQSIN
jgi:hypothetical protein